ncbi:hypothetical protein HCN44_004834 [Aphidius gifuensis]|uniref:Uncharacterized protein n=1 Tax=Aphidius gifuensis TaxID=684658 RepID=A0A834XS76_APHGI|nr:hypothetical protein HCN44_004834 [Aphidius gifuensis]
MLHSHREVRVGSTWLEKNTNDFREYIPRKDGTKSSCSHNSAAGSGALEHNFFCLYRPLLSNKIVPGQLLLGVAVIDSSVLLFGQIFPNVVYKFCLEMLEHFNECVKQAKSERQEAIQMKIKFITDNKLLYCF